MENLQLALIKAAIYGGGASATVIVVILLWRQLVGIGRAVRKRPVWERVLIAWLVAALIAYGGSKPGGGTNEVENGEAVSRPLQLGAGIWLPIRSGQGITRGEAELAKQVARGVTASPLSVTDEDLARGWRLWEVRTNADWSAAMPEGAALCTNWWLRGAYEDVVRIGIGDQGSGMSGWRFPFGSNEWDSVWAFTWGKLRFALRDRATEIAAVGAPMAAVPFCSRLWTAADTNGARLVTWENFTLGRIPAANYQLPSTNYQLVSAQIELRRNGDFVTRSNEVETVYHVIDDFDWDGDGIVNELDDAPYVYDGDYCGQDEEYREWVDGTVGWGLENGYYKLTVTVPGIDFRRRAISVGSERVVADQPGEYVFLLEKGVDYVFCIEPFSPDVRFSVADDLPSVSSPLMLSLGWGWWSDWTMDGGDLVFTPPSFVRPGHCRWMPTLQVTPSAQHLGPGDSPQTFTAELSDFAYAQSVRYEWSSDDWNISFSNPQSEETEIDVWDMPTWGEGDVWATVTIGTNELTSSTHFHYGEHHEPQVILTLSTPNVVLVSSNMPNEVNLQMVSLSFCSDVVTNGTIRLECDSGRDNLILWRNANGTGRVSLPLSWDAATFGGWSAYAEGVKHSNNTNDVAFRAQYIPVAGDTINESRRLTVAEVWHETIAPVLSNPGRTELGVGEDVWFFVKPEQLNISGIVSAGKVSNSLGSSFLYTAPSTACKAVVTIDLGAAAAVREFNVIAPTGYEVSSVLAKYINAPNMAGLFSLEFDTKLKPTTVSFYAVQVMEIPMVSTNALGYFALPEHADALDHGNRGAYGKWTDVGYDNSSPDIVQVGHYAMPWGDGGSYTWPIPNVWHVKGEDQVTNVFVQTDQRYELESNGTARVFKFGYVGERTTNNLFRAEEVIGK